MEKKDGMNLSRQFSFVWPQNLKVMACLSKASARHKEKEEMWKKKKGCAFSKWVLLHILFPLSFSSSIFLTSILFLSGAYDKFNHKNN